MLLATVVANHRCQGSPWRRR